MLKIKDIIRDSKSVSAHLAVIFILFVILNLALISAEGVYFYKNDEDGILKPTLVEYDSKGEINIDENERVYLSKEGDNPKNLLGYMNNVKIKKDGNGNIVEFKKDGSLTRFPEKSPPSQYDFGNIKEGGKIYFNNKGDISKAEFESNGKAVFYLNNFGYDVPAGTELKYENQEIYLKLKNGGSFSYFQEKEPDKKKSFSNIKPGGEFKINSKGEIIKLKFETSKEQDIELKGYKYKLPENGEIDFEGNKALITLPDGAKLEYPQKVGEIDKDFLFSFKTKSGKGIILPNGDLFEVKGKESVLNYKDGFYFSDKNAVIKKNGKDDLFIHNAGGDVYLFFKENEIDKTKNSIFLGEDKITLTSLNGKGAAVSFAENNRVDAKVGPKNSVAAQANNGRVFIEKAEPEKLPSVKLSGESIVTLDKRSFYGKNNGELYFNTEGTLMGDFNHGKYDTPVKLSFVDNDGKNLRDFDVFSNGKDQYASVIHGKFESSLEFFKTKGDFYVSSTLTFNQLTPEAQEFYDGLSSEDQKKLSKYVGGGEKENSALLQRTINELIVEKEKRTKNPYYASAKLSSYGTGGSATIIGLDKEGHPIALTAGHVVSMSGQEVTLTLETDKGEKTYSGKVVAGSEEPDVALIKIDQVDFDAHYTPVGSVESIKVGDNVLRMGYPADKGRAFESVQGRITQIIGEDNRVWASEEVGPYPGSSGGGLFLNGKLIGITSRTPGWGSGYGQYTNPDDMRELLRKNGYDYLIKIIIVLYS